MDNTDSKLVRPGDPRVPCIAILDRDTSELKLVNLEGGSSSSVKISDHESRGIVTNNGEVYAVTRREILKVRSDGTTEHLSALPGLWWPRVVLFQKKIYIIQSHGESMLCFDPADNSLTDDLPGCGLSYGFCASATDDFICAMGGYKSETRSMMFDPVKLKWKKKKMRKRRWAAAATLDGKIYVMGGWPNGTSVEYYNPGNNSWTEISNMNADRSFFSACVVGDRLYAVGGDGEEENGFYQRSIEVYDKNKWTIATKFQTKDLETSSCFWPHGSHQPGGVLTEVKAAADQLAIGNADVTEQDAGSNYVAGDFDKKVRGSTLNNFVADKETRSGGNNCSFNTAAYQVAIGGEKNTSETKHITGDDSTVVKAPVGQLVTGNANITEQGARNSNVTGDVSNVVDAPVGQVAAGNTNITNQGSRNGDVPGDASTVVNATVGQVATGDANITEQGAGSSNVPGVSTVSNVNITEQSKGNNSVTGDASTAMNASVGQLATRNANITEHLVTNPKSDDAIYRSAFAYSLGGIAAYQTFMNQLLARKWQLPPAPRDASTVANAPVGQLATGDANITEQGAGSSNVTGSSGVGLKLGDGAAVEIKEFNYHVHVQGGDKASAVGFELGPQGTVNIKGNVDVHAGAKGDASTAVNAPVGQVSTGNANITNQGSGNSVLEGDASTAMNAPVGQLATGDANITEQGAGNSNIPGDVSTAVNAPVGQLADGNANITEQGAGNSDVPGDASTAMNVPVGQFATGDANITEQGVGNSDVPGEVSTVVKAPVGQFATGDANIKEQGAGNSDVPGDASTVVNAPVGQLATGNARISEQGAGNSDVTDGVSTASNANITEQRKGNNYVTEIGAWDRAITAGRDVLINLPGEVLVLWVLVWSVTKITSKLLNRSQ